MELLTSKVLDVCSGIGRLMLENGAETYRVEDTVYRVAANYGMQGISVFSVPSALIITLHDQTGQAFTRLHRVMEQRSNLDIVSEANALSRRIELENITPNEALLEIDRLNRQPPNYTVFEEIFAASIVCAFFTMIFLGTISDLFAAALVGGVGYTAFLFSQKVISVRFLSEMVAALVIAWLAVLLSLLGLGTNLDTVILASVMTLVPGKAITNGIRDLMAHHFISGVSVLSDAFLTAAAIGIGVATVFAFFI